LPVIRRRYLGFIKNQKVDLVLSDYRMPQMDGVTFARVLREMGWAGQLFFMSGYVAELNGQELSDLNVSGILEKTFNVMELTEFIIQAFEQELAGNPL
jgi:CheY-like chemotaxis protein